MVCPRFSCIYRLSDNHNHMLMKRLKQLINRNKLLSSTVLPIYSALNRDKNFTSGKYWEQRYNKGGDSGAGSYGRLAQFKADIINRFIAENQLKSAIEFGCGDGNQLGLLNLERYTGFDVSKQSIALCSEKYKNDDGKAFFLYDSVSFVDTFHVFQADLTMSLDVIYHLTEDDVFEKYVRDMFNCSTRHVLIYSSDKNEQTRHQAQHVKHRKFTKWIEENISGWSFEKKIQNEFPLEDNAQEESFADFYVYKKD